MSDVARILRAIEQGDPHAVEQLLPLVYEELRRLAAQKLAAERPGQTLQATDLVHEAYLRLVASPERDSFLHEGTEVIDSQQVEANDSVCRKPVPSTAFRPLMHKAGERGEERRWDSPGHFFAAAAEAMRRILIENARRKKRQKHGGDLRRVELAADELPDEASSDGLLDLDEALTRLAAEDSPAAEVVKLHIYAGLSIEEAATALGISRATAYRHWTYARAWLRCALRGPDAPSAI